MYSVCVLVLGKGIVLARPPFPQLQMRELTDMLGVLCTCENYRDLLVNILIYVYINGTPFPSISVCPSVCPSVHCSSVLLLVLLAAATA